MTALRCASGRQGWLLCFSHEYLCKCVCTCVHVRPCVWTWVRARSPEVKHAREQLGMRERHLREVSQAFVHLAPTDALRREQAEEAEREAQALQVG